MGTLSRDQILARFAEMPRSTVEVPDLGPVCIRIMTVKEVSDFQRAVDKNKDMINTYPKLLATACCNEDGSPLFVGEDVRAIEGMPWHAIDHIAKEIMYANKLMPRPKAEPRDDEDGEEAPKAEIALNGSR